MAIPVTGRYTRTLLPLLLISALCLGEISDSPKLTYRTGASEVRLRFSALDQNNHGVATLQANDFAVVDKDFIVRDFQSFSRADWTNIELAILFDASESVAPQFQREVSGILDMVSQTTGIPDESLSIFSFQGTRPAVFCAGNCRASLAAGRLPVPPAGGLTPLFDTVVLASDILSKRGDAHAEKVLILFSDGKDTVSRYSLSDAIDSALTADVQICAIDLGNSGDYAGASSTLHRLTFATGGRYFPVRDGARNALNVVLEGFRATYMVTYRLPNHADGFHAIRILPTHNLNLQFRSRSGYYYPTRIR